MYLLKIILREFMPLPGTPEMAEEIFLGFQDMPG